MQARAAPLLLQLPAAGLAHGGLAPRAQGLDEDAEIFWLPRRVQCSPPWWSEVFLAFSQIREWEFFNFV